MFCPNCGAEVKSGARFCESCGAALEAGTVQREDGFYGYNDGVTRLAPGYSRKLESDSVMLALKKQRRTVRIALALLIVLPLIGFAIYGAVSDKMEFFSALGTGLLVSVIMAIASLIALLKQKLTKPFEGTVADKKHYRHIGSSSRRPGRSRNQWRITVDCEDGKRRKKDVQHAVYNYLEIGDRVRFLPQFPQPFEKYDKSRDAEIPCMFCGQMNPVANDDCQFCHNPLIK